MKTSNIILLSLFGIIVIGIIFIQLQLKSAMTNTEEQKTIEFQLDSFNKLNIASGWYINIKQGNDFKVTLTDDNFKRLVHVENGILYCDKLVNEEITRISADIIVRDINDVIILGNSIVNYYSKEIDSMNLELNDKGRFGIYKLGDEEDVVVENQDQTLEYLHVNMFGRSKLYIRYDVDLLNGEMKDTCVLYFDGHINFNNFTSGKETYLSTW